MALATYCSVLLYVLLGIANLPLVSGSESLGAARVANPNQTNSHGRRANQYTIGLLPVQQHLYITLLPAQTRPVQPLPSLWRQDAFQFEYRMALHTDSSPLQTVQHHAELWYDGVENDTVPEITSASARSTVCSLHQGTGRNTN